MRKVKEYELQDDGKALKVRITQMPAQQAAYFVIDVLCLLGVESMSALSKKSSEEIVSSMVRAARDKAEVHRLLDQLLCCCERVTETGGTVALTPATVSGQVSDWLTVISLYVLSLEVNGGFFGAGALDRFREAASSIGQQLRSVGWLST